MNKLYAFILLNVLVFWTIQIPSVNGLVHAQNAGITPVYSDGFETGDWRNFRPHYIGDSEEWIRPQFSINDVDPLSGNYSLQWTAGEEDHEWVMVSNAFYLGLPATVSPGGGYEYHSFPFEVRHADGLDMFASLKTDIQLNSWQPDEGIVGEGEIKARPTRTGHAGEIHTQVQWEITKLIPGETYLLELDGQIVAEQTADQEGVVLFTAITNGDEGPVSFRIRRAI